MPRASPVGRPGEWRIVYHVAAEDVVVLDVFQKKTQATPPVVIRNCKDRLAAYRKAIGTKKPKGSTDG